MLGILVSEDGNVKRVRIPDGSHGVGIWEALGARVLSVAATGAGVDVFIDDEGRIMGRELNPTLSIMAEQLTGDHGYRLYGPGLFLSVTTPRGRPVSSPASRSAR